jgi:hypothetical protein
MASRCVAPLCCAARAVVPMNGQAGGGVELSFDLGEECSEVIIELL